VLASSRAKGRISPERGERIGGAFRTSETRFHAKKRWRELGYASAFAYLRGEFKLSEGAAYNRIVAAELVDRMPEVEAAVRSGDLCFSTVNQVAKVLTPENKDELLPRFLHLSRRQAEQLAVSLRPVEVIPLREVVTAIRPPRAAARAAAALETCAAGTDAFQLHPGEVANEVGGSPSADASLFQLGGPAVPERRGPATRPRAGGWRHVPFTRFSCADRAAPVPAYGAGPRRPSSRAHSSPLTRHPRA
jgi:hypothetical protein